MLVTGQAHVKSLASAYSSEQGSESDTFAQPATYLRQFPGTRHAD